MSKRTRSKNAAEHRRKLRRTRRRQDRRAAIEDQERTAAHWETYSDYALSGPGR